MEPSQADLARALRVLTNCNLKLSYSEYTQLQDAIATALQACQADIWLEAGRMADNVGKMATVMGDINTARGQYSLADIFKSKAAAIRAADMGVREEGV